MSIQMELQRIIISEMQDRQIIVLKEVDGERTFPIVIGSTEAFAIDRRLKGIPAPRPLTHDLLANVIEAMGGFIEKIEITHLEVTGGEGTFIAQLSIRQGDKLLQIDCRPSDAIALGASSGTPVFVAEQVMEEAAS